MNPSYVTTDLVHNPLARLALAMLMLIAAAIFLSLIGVVLDLAEKPLNLPPLCKDCKFYLSHSHRCANPEILSLINPSPVTGLKPRSSSCLFERHRDGRCKPDAKYFQFIQDQ